jgi:hypothetical protein
MRVGLGYELTNSYDMAGKFIFGLTSFMELWLHFSAVAELIHTGEISGLNLCPEVWYPNPLVVLSQYFGHIRIEP